ncbi:unnamed protein product [Mytilus coruscus]|uniref:Uncharacterized protein n=1 Tax=Mytilus coruscus TaxID=42192 RepID=A0A6J8C674_MYTCO|nr:unnamed protein product [Mytilus coruscus]
MDSLKINFVVFLSFFSLIDGSPNCNSKNAYRIVISDDCRTVWRCRRPGMSAMKLADCPEGTVVGRGVRCVPEGSSLNVCTVKKTCGLNRNPCRHGGTCVSGTKPKEFGCECRVPYKGRYCEIVPSPAELCVVSPRYTRLPDKEYCQTYFDCGDKTGEPVKKECSYPLQFDVEKQSCEDFHTVKCGNRKNLKSKCQYNKYKSMRSPFTSCEMAYPSCEKKPNGFQPHLKRPQSPWYMVCKDEHLVKTGFCGSDKNGKEIATKDGCKNAFDVPQKDGGLKPSCKGKPEGFYPLQGGSCQQFFYCKRDKTYINRCPNFLTFDTKIARCRLKIHVCRPCGTKKC